MEDISNTVNPKIPVQSNDNPVTQKIKPKPLKLNFLQYFFIFAITIFLTIIVTYFVMICNFAFDLTSRQKENNNRKINPINIPTQTIQETIPTEIEEENNQNKNGQGNIDTNKNYKAVSVKDDKNSTTKLILIDQKNNETIIEEVKSILPCYGGFNFSSDNNYLHYCNGCLGCYSTLYDIKNKKIIRLNMETEIKGFTSNSKYFYACARSGPGSGGAVVKELSSLKDVFIIKGDYKCQHNRNTGEIIFSEVSPSFDDDGKILSEYKFSEKTGVLTKIK